MFLSRICSKASKRGNKNVQLVSKSVILLKIELKSDVVRCLSHLSYFGTFGEANEYWSFVYWFEKSCLDWFLNTRTERVQFEMTCLPVLPSVLESRFILYSNDLIFVCSYIAFVAGARKYLMGARKNWAREGAMRRRGRACPRAPWQSFPPFPITWRPLRDLSKQCWQKRLVKAYQSVVHLYPRSKFICYKNMIIERWGATPTINTQH